MKKLKPSIRDENWCEELTCTNCQAGWLVEAGDLNAELALSSPFITWTCPDCSYKVFYDTYSIEKWGFLLE